MFLHKNKKVVCLGRELKTKIFSKHNAGKKECTRKLGEVSEMNGLLGNAMFGSALNAPDDVKMTLTLKEAL